MKYLRVERYKNVTVIYSIDTYLLHYLIRPFYAIFYPIAILLAFLLSILYLKANTLTNVKT